MVYAGAGWAFDLFHRVELFDERALFGFAVTPVLAKVLGRRPGNIHVLRHTFCSHLAMRGAPAVTIKELAGHANLSTTMRYMHLQAGAKQAAIALLAGAQDVLGPSESASAGGSGVAWQRRGNGP